MNRRLFLERTAQALIATGGLGVVACGSNEAELPDDLDNVERGHNVPFAMGVQLYTLRTLLEEDVAGTLEALAAIGFEQVETAGYHGYSPEEFRSALNAAGLRAPAGHKQLPQLSPDALPATLEEAEALGYEYLVCPWIGEEQRQTLDDYRELADTFNDIGSRCADAGLRFAFHNHDFEFEPIDGEVPFDILVERTEPRLVDFEMDLYWVVAAGADPVEYLERYPGRFPLFHVKDYDPDGDPAMVDVGDGIIPFEEIFAVAEETGGISHAFVEHDNPSDPLESVTRSFQHLTSLYE